ncbi:hypothetical protein thsrh120_54310 [Rhizobium sp. No.120]
MNIRGFFRQVFEYRENLTHFFIWRWFNRTVNAGKPGKWMIPVPATYVIDRLGKVVLAAIDIDYRNRLDPTELLSALRRLGSRVQPDHGK